MHPKDVDGIGNSGGTDQAVPMEEFALFAKPCMSQYWEYLQNIWCGLDCISDAIFGNFLGK